MYGYAQKKLCVWHWKVSAYVKLCRIHNAPACNFTGFKLATYELQFVDRLYLFADQFNRLWHMYMPIHMPKTLETCKKKHALFD